MLEQVNLIEKSKGEFGEMLRLRRVRLNKSGQQIARECGISLSTVRHWESGTAFPSEEELPDKPSMITRIIKAYEISDLDDFNQKLRNSKKAREKELSFFHPKNLRRPKVPAEDRFSGYLPKRPEAERLNPDQYPNHRFGRQ